MHAEAERTDRELLPEIVSRLLERHDQCRARRREAWREHAAAERSFRAAYEGMAAAAERSAERSRGLDIEGLEL